MKTTRKTRLAQGAPQVTTTLDISKEGFSTEQWDSFAVDAIVVAAQGKWRRDGEIPTGLVQVTWDDVKPEPRGGPRQVTQASASRDLERLKSKLGPEAFAAFLKEQARTQGLGGLFDD